MALLPIKTFKPALNHQKNIVVHGTIKMNSKVHAAKDWENHSQKSCKKSLYLLHLSPQVDLGRHRNDPIAPPVIQISHDSCIVIFRYIQSQNRPYH